eukprot:Gb_40413 [translate_table: standard]
MWVAFLEEGRRHGAMRVAGDSTVRAMRGEGCSFIGPVRGQERPTKGQQGCAARGRGTTRVTREEGCGSGGPTKGKQSPVEGQWGFAMRGRGAALRGKEASWQG